MKNFVLWLYVAIFAVASASTVVHVRSLRDAGEHLSRLQPLYERLPVFPELRLAMEKYRRASGNFRKMYNVDIAESKTRVRQEMSAALARLDRLDSTEAERVEVQAIQTRLGELLQLSAKYEPQLYLKDAYQKPDVQEAHENILKDIDNLETGTKARLEAASSDSSRDSSRNSDRSIRLIIAAEGAILLLVLSMIVRMYLTQSRPIRRLARYAEELAGNGAKIEIPKRLPPRHRKVAETLANLAGQAELLRDQRSRFIADVIDDLRPGLSALKRSTDVDEAVSILSSSLEDLQQLSEISRIDRKMNPAVVDLSELLSDVCKRAHRAGLCPEVKVSLPELPTWVRMDGPRVDRAMTQILAKLGETLEKGQKIEAILQVGQAGQSRSKQGWIEVSFHSSGQKMAGAPEQEIGKHWISQRGLALMLAQKVVKAHEGSIFAAGLIGSPVHISIKFSRSILTDGLVAPAMQTPAQVARNLSPSNMSQGLELDNLNAT
jgi:hypothetical protein